MLEWGPEILQMAAICCGHVVESYPHNMCNFPCRLIVIGWTNAYFTFAVILAFFLLEVPIYFQG